MDNRDKDFAGKNGFIWWIGVVENRQDPLKLGRCKVRIFGWHPEELTSMPTSHLPWTESMFPVNNPNPYAPKEGEMVMGFFLDGTEAQHPVMLGVIPGIPVFKSDSRRGFNDVRTEEQLSAAPVKPDESQTLYPRALDEPTTSRLARGETLDKTIVQYKKDKKLSKVEPDPYYNAKYPYNNVYESESGHALEFDDTKDSERVHLYHRSGSYVEFGPDGSRAERIQKDKFTVIVGDDSVYVQGSVKMYVDGDYDLNVTGDIRINGKTVNINNGSMGAARINDSTLDNDSELNGPDTGAITTGSGTVFIGD
jgi:hypothetical protein